jgi:DNA-binding transcriptional regulator LsrR (DeoR family)
MKVYFGQDGQYTAQHARATHLTVTEMARKTDGHGHKLYVDNIFSSPQVFDELAKYRFTVAVLSGQTEEACHKTPLKTTKVKRGDV